MGRMTSFASNTQFRIFTAIAVLATCASGLRFVLAGSLAPTALPNAIADRVLGQVDFSSIGSGATGAKFNVPAGIAIVPPGAPAQANPGRLFVADYNNARVLSWPGASSFISGQKADLVLGQPDVDTVNDPLPLNSQHLYGPESLAIDLAGNVYVADTLGHRILRFVPPFSTNMSAERVFGQGTSGTNFAGQDPNSPSLSASSLYFPRGLAVDVAQNLHVADDFNNRVLIFYNPADPNKSAAVTADVVIGQNNMTSNGAGGGQNGMESPKGVAVDGFGYLYVASWADNRVLMFQPPLTTGMLAIRVFGQGDSGASFNTNAAGTSATAMNRPVDLAVDGVGNLYVSDQHNNRVLVFFAANEAIATSAVTADFVYGQGGAGNNFGAANPGPVGDSQFYRVNEGPLGVAVGGDGTVYVAEFDANRVLAFDGVKASKVVGGGTPESCTESALATQLDGGGAVTFNCGGSKTIVFTSQKAISADTVIDGNDQITLSGGNATRLFTVAGNVSLTIRRVRLMNGYALGDGGAIYNAGSLSVEQSTIMDSHATASGGAIVSYGPLAIRNSTLVGNGASNGGAIYPRFPAATTLIIGSNLRNNHATGATDGWGGAILLWDGASLAVTGGELAGNTATLGGAIHNRFANSSVELRDVMFRNNASEGDGGGVYNLNGIANVANSTFAGNSANRGGGVYSRNATTRIGNTTFSDNSSATEGGAVYNFNSGTTISFTTFSGNFAAGQGGAIYQVAARSLTVSNIALQHGASADNCFVAEIDAHTVFAGGANISDDNSCAAHFFAQPGDRNNTDPLIGPLLNNGGPTPSHMPLPGSPMIDGGQCAAGVSTDQRGVARPQGAACDVGAIEKRAADSQKIVHLPVQMR